MTEPHDAEVIRGAKRELRSAVRRRRDARPAAERERHDRSRFDRVRDLLAARQVHRMAAYLSTGTEPDSLRLVAWARAGSIEVLLPVLTDGAGSWLPSPDWAVYQGPAALREGRSMILEPTGPTLGSQALDGVDLLVVPGLAADWHGHRLGRGGGWYDRARRERADLETWLLLNDDEVVEVVPTDPWDLAVDVIITPQLVQRTARGGDSPGLIVA